MCQWLHIIIQECANGSRISSLLATMAPEFHPYMRQWLHWMAIWNHWHQWGILREVTKFRWIFRCFFSTQGVHMLQIWKKKLWGDRVTRCDLIWVFWKCCDVHQCSITILVTFCVPHLLLCYNIANILSSATQTEAITLLHQQAIAGVYWNKIFLKYHDQIPPPLHTHTLGSGALINMEN